MRRFWVSGSLERTLVGQRKGNKEGMARCSVEYTLYVYSDETLHSGWEK